MSGRSRDFVVWAVAVGFWGLVSPLATSTLRAQNPATPRGVEFFESRIRPVLVEHCYECHNSADNAESGLAVDHRAAIRKGGDGGAIITPGDPAKSRLLAILRHEVDGMEMPQDGPKLDPQVVADFTKWIAMGAPDPRDKAPSAAEVAEATSWTATLARRKQWWSFQPIREVSPPDGSVADWEHPIDRFLAAKIRGAGLEPTSIAPSDVLVRRLYFALVGLPPSPEEALQWTQRLNKASDRNQAWDALVDHLLKSPRFGERWARHWMDWIRYAESHGSEGDPVNDNAWVYRDYLIRALNADVGYDQLLREHVAGDLLKEPRINAEMAINESAIGPAHWRMVFHGFAPTDALDEKVRFTDDQINAFSKAFLGLTVSCARCHDHKFDAISQKDYYALFGILGSCRPGRTVIDLPSDVGRNLGKLKALKSKIRVALAEDWEAAAAKVAEKLEDASFWNGDRGKATQSVLKPLRTIRDELAKGVAFNTAWSTQLRAYADQAAALKSHRERAYPLRWDLSGESGYNSWHAHGQGLPASPSAAGEFAMATEGDRALQGIYPGGVYSHTISSKHPARLTSGDFKVEEDSEVWVRVLGESGASFRYVVQNYPRSGTVYPVARLSNEWRWQRYDVSYWKGDLLHLELAAARDAPLLVSGQDRSWFGIREAVVLRKGSPSPADVQEQLHPIFEASSSSSPKSLPELYRCYEQSLLAAVRDWKKGSASDAQALLLDRCLREGLLPNSLMELAKAKPEIEAYRRMEQEIPTPRRVPGLDETVGRNQPLFQRGNHKRPGDPVPRRFLEAIDNTPYQDGQSGRRELAEDLLRDDNPLTRRVIVNRLWRHLFGRGIVASPDNFGRLGQRPSHPDLLDWLAEELTRRDWSLKQMIRLMVTSRAWRLSSQADAKAVESDPENRWLARANVRRLEAEAIRDALLSVSGRMQHELGGPPVDGKAPRRSVYVRVKRNSLDPFLRVFDFPEPYSTVGRRDETNVPAQSLAMLNNGQVSELANAWAKRLVDDASATHDGERIEQLFLTAFGRTPAEQEKQRVRQYLRDTRTELETRGDRIKVVQRGIFERENAIESILKPVRERLLAEAGKNLKEKVAKAPQPIGRWEFDRSLKDVVAEAHGDLKGGAKIEEGALIVRGGGHVVTAPIKKTLRAKTLEAWVRLDSLGQRGGGVITLQTPDGNVFDSIVFGEIDAGHWLAGSDFHRRTKSFNGPRESQADKQSVHLAIVYHEDGRISGYRNGLPYGKPYQSNGPVEFRAGQAVVGFGVRHLPAGGNRLLSGRILRAQLYDRALSAEEVAASAGAMSAFVSDKDVLAALPEASRRQVASLRSQLKDARKQLEAIGPVPATVDELALWSDLARAVFTFKEFIYVR